MRACKAVLQCFSVLAVVKTWHGHLRVAKRLDKLFKKKFLRFSTFRRSWSLSLALLPFSLAAEHMHFLLQNNILTNWRSIDFLQRRSWVAENVTILLFCSNTENKYSLGIDSYFKGVLLTL